MYYFLVLTSIKIVGVGEILPTPSSTSQSLKLVTTLTLTLLDSESYSLVCLSSSLPCCVIRIMQE